MSRTFGELVHKTRTEAGRSLRSVAGLLGVSHVFLSDVERGRNRLAPRHWKGLVEALPGLSIEVLAQASVADGRIRVDASMLTGPQRAILAAAIEAEARAA
jgi:transcriptional regulator with XRE-family HTH domain